MMKRFLCLLSHHQERDAEESQFQKKSIAKLLWQWVR